MTAAVRGEVLDISGAPLVSVVIPCLNEEASVGECVTEAIVTLAAMGVSGEVVVVDNGSTDRSMAVAADAGAVVLAEARPGYGRALRTGIEAARGAVVVMADADLTYDFTRLPELLAPILSDAADLVVGSRLNSATHRNMPPLHRYVGTPALSFLVRRAGRHGTVSDSQSGYRAFRRSTAADMSLSSTGMEFASEMLIKAGQLGLRVAEVETGYRERVGESKLNTFRDGFRHARLIFLLAPELLLVGPGAGAFLIGVILAGLGFLSPGGVEVGSLRWQPIFFSTIALVLGMEMTLVGMLLAARSPLAPSETRRRFHFVAHPRFPDACLQLGVVGLLLGLGVDLALFLRHTWGLPFLSITMALASTAQSLILGGGSLTALGFVMKALAFSRSDR